MASYHIKFEKVAHIGNNVSHAKNRTKRPFRRNLHAVTLLIDGVKKKCLLPVKLIHQLRRDGMTTHWQPKQAE